MGTESDCGVRVFLNEHAVIVDRMPQPTRAEEAFGFNSVSLVSPEEVSKIKKTESQKTELVAGEKYRIRLELVHSSHLKYGRPDTGVLRRAVSRTWLQFFFLNSISILICNFFFLNFIAILICNFSNRLLWRSGSKESEVVPEKYFFSTNASPTTKFSGCVRGVSGPICRQKSSFFELISFIFISEITCNRLDPKLFETGFLRDGVQPFVDNKDHFLADVPLRFLGRRLLLSLHQPNMSSFSFELNGPSLLFIASPKEEPLPLEAAAGGPPWRAHDTRESLTLLSGEDASGRALEATQMQIRFISFKTSEEIKFKLSKTAVPFLFFAEPRRGEALSCGELRLRNWALFRHFSRKMVLFFAIKRKLMNLILFLFLFSSFSQKDAEEVLLSLPGGPAFAHCEATSERPGGFDCRAGLNGQHLDKSFGTWKTRGPGKKN